MDKTALIVIGSYIAVYFTGYMTREFISRWRRRHHEPRLLLR